MAGRIMDFVRQQLKVNERQLTGLRDCTVSYDDYVESFARKGCSSTPNAPRRRKEAARLGASVWMNCLFYVSELVDAARIELATSALRTQRSPS